jgi:hypothetical protein
MMLFLMTFVISKDRYIFIPNAFHGGVFKALVVVNLDTPDFIKSNFSHLHCLL